MSSALLRVYDRYVLGKPWVFLGMVLLIFGFFATQIPHFKLDASSESLVLENDKDLRYFRDVTKKYGSSDFLIITYTPYDDLLSEKSLGGLKALEKDLKKLSEVDSVISILNVPLLNSPKVTFSELAENDRTLMTPGVDYELARKEFQESPIYRKLLVSPDGRTTAILVNFKRDEKYYTLLRTRNDLREKKRTGTLSVEEADELKRVSYDFKQYLAVTFDRQSAVVEKVRGIMGLQRPVAELFLGGLPMIISDMVDFIDHDISVFGLGVMFFMIVALGFFFRKVRWIGLPMVCCLVSALTMVGFWGFSIGG